MQPSETKHKPVVFSGIQPTGKMHIGNYIGALIVWAANQSKYDNIFRIVDLHALTIPEDIRPEYLRRKVVEFAALYIACGIDPEQSAKRGGASVSIASQISTIWPGGGGSLWVREFLERAPELALPTLTRPLLLRFLIMKPGVALSLSHIPLAVHQK